MYKHNLITDSKKKEDNFLVEIQYDEIEERSKDIDNIHEQIVQINDIMYELQNIVFEQKKSVETIEQCIINSNHNITKGNQTLEDTCDKIEIIPVPAVVSTLQTYSKIKKYCQIM